jgi:heavy metal translocating P-type ATPase
MHKKHHNHKISTFEFTGNSFYFLFDAVLALISIASLFADFFHIFSGFLDLVLLATVAIIGFLPVLFSAIKALIKKKLTIDLLASIALLVSLLNKEFNSAVFISLMLVSARLFAYFTENRKKRAIQSLLKLRPTRVLIKTEQGIIEKSVEEVKVGDLVIVESGERVAIDGIVIEGNASVDQSSLTGESELISKSVGEEVFSSTLNVSGSLVVKATKIGEDTTFAKILKLIEESQKGKAPIASITDKFTNYYILITIFGSILLFLFTHNLLLVLSILLVTCADDLAIAIPLAFITAIGTAAKNGIIIKGASFIEGLPKVKLMIFDKTGTLTESRPIIQNISVFGKYSEKQFLGVLSGLIEESNHPTSKIICQFVKEKSIKPVDMSQVQEEAGQGISGVSRNKRFFVGNIKFLASHDIVFSEKESLAIEDEKSFGRTILGLGANNSLIGFIAFSDSIRHQALHIIGEIKKLGVERVVMLTGDNEAAAGRVAKEVGIAEFKANLLPQDKVDFVKSVLSKKYKVAMVGDGVNDAAPLALSDIGFVMGSIGSDAAIEAADVALMKDKLANIADAIQISKKTMKIVRQNLWLWGIVNAVGLIFVFSGIFGPSAAAAYNFLTDFISPLNSLRLLRYHRKN